jgi:hypothetical protein
MRRDVSLVSVALDNKETNYLFLRPNFPRAVNVPEHLMTAGHPGRARGGFSFGSLSFDHNANVASHDEHVRASLAFDDVPVLVMGVVAQESQSLD